MCTNKKVNIFYNELKVIGNKQLYGMITFGDWVNLPLDFLLAMAIDQPSMKKDGERRKGKGRRVFLGGRIYSFPCRASCLAFVDWEEKVEFILFFQIDQNKTASAARNWINFAPQTDDLCLCFCLHPSSMPAMLCMLIACKSILYGLLQGTWYEAAKLVGLLSPDPHCLYIV